MIKRILILVVVLLLIVPTSAQADDAGPELDDKNYLSIKVTPLSDSIEYGGDFEFMLELTNNSTDKIMLEEISRIFEGIYDSLSFTQDFDTSNDDCIILSGQKLILTLKAQVPLDIDWYKLDDKYYTDLNLRLNYSVSEYILEQGEDIDAYYGHKSDQLAIYPLLITNIIDGNEFINITIHEHETIFNFIENKEWYVDYCANMSHQISIENISDYDIDYMYLNGVGNLNGLLASKAKSAEVSTYYELNEKEVESVMPAEYKAIYKLENQYYAASIIKEYPTKLINHPRLDVQLVSEENNYYLEFTNSTENTLENLYFFLKDKYIINDPSIHSTQPVTLKKDESYRLLLDSELPYQGHIFYGIVYDSILYSWSISEYNDFQDFHYEYYKSFNIIEIKNTPSPISTLSTSPPTQPHTPSPTVSPTEKPVIEVVEVKKSNSIPFWVWYVLTVTVIVCAVLIIVFRKKNKEDKYD